MLPQEAPDFMKHISTLIAVQNMEASRRFYKTVLGLEVVSDFGANVTLSGGISLQTLESWREFIGNKPVTLAGHPGELYFEEQDMDGFLSRLNRLDVPLVHPPLTHRWGQRVVRFYDPDFHVIEVGEDMVTVVKRFAGQGMTPAQVAQQMDVPLSYVQQCLTAEQPSGQPVP